MAGVTKVEIRESVEELHGLLRKQKTASSLERIQALYLLKIGQVKTIQDVAVVVGRARVTVQRWLKDYQESGINGLLSMKKSPGRPAIISLQVREQLDKELEQSEGFTHL
ncbi:helix-turn-helix domain-containing protein [Nostoc sp. WHI]|uniref:helix-turn-helix domain-containing protein n=1 Tax=Nostoc sp. WHI TaxID=2650611 RepID=UPI0018C80389|nr:helix-turn-helix domain-containing protein [Nostoc sp. WHI]MBG1266437.1 helix-turn-helix domain-containing protein [Nostoc sp. WHI]MBG1267954.1 helix-turn-helix domain-containing protein [Nostoc sp. WHI]